MTDRKVIPIFAGLVAPQPKALQVNGVGRSVDPTEQAERVLEVYFDRRPTDDELRAFHDYVRGFQSESGARVIT